MEAQELKRAVEAEVERRERRVLNKNALDALIAAIPGGALIQLFAKREDAVDDERRRIQIDLVVDLVTQFDDAISELQRNASEQGISVSGLIEAKGTDADEVVAARIRAGARNVELSPGTHIRAEGLRVKRITGLDIGGE